ncbi:MAG: sigma-70 family RNA polymerase sigma factor [Oscillospiraceae bacterium]|jgi:RNA polymerase sigma-70 factor (ECF subfamily)|nr:sigma-70 family RNA polymerase sigma factor [Oscillospiraceae bacterium]
MLPIFLSMIDNEEDKSLFEEFYKLYRQDMFKIADRILKNESDAEDAVSEAFFRIANNFSKIKDVHIKQSRAFAAVTIENVAKNIYVYKRNRPAQNIEDFDDIWDDENLEDDVVINASVDTIINALKSLTENYYSVLYMTIVCGYSISEVSALLGLTRENTKKIYARAKRKIREITESELFI